MTPTLKPAAPEQGPPLPDSPFVVGRTYLVSRSGGHPRELDLTAIESLRHLLLCPLTSIGPATVLNSRKSKTGAREVYITFVGQDKRLDCWVPSSDLAQEVIAAGPSRIPGVADILVGSPYLRL